MGKRRRLVWLGLAAAGVAAAVLYAPAPEPLAELSASTGEARNPPRTAINDSRLGALPDRETLGKPRGNVFASQSWEPPPPPRRAAVAVAPAPVAPSAPPMPYRVAGKVVHEGGAHIVLAKGDRVFWVREGETLDDGYRIDAITSERVTLTYLPLDLAQHLQVVSSLEVDVPPVTRTASAASPPSAAIPPGPAQLRFEGPHEVRGGNPFSVALKVTSGRPVRASPLQLSFDAKLVEPVNVRAGGFFAGGSFTYRVSPSGSIFVGASGKGQVPADAEFLVVTFKPIGSAGTAEIKLSSLILQDASGRAIVHDQPAAFRTAILQ